MQAWDDVASGVTVERRDLGSPDALILHRPESSVALVVADAACPDDVVAALVLAAVALTEGEARPEPADADVAPDRWEAPRGLG